MAVSIIQETDEYCYLCGKGLYGKYDVHHIFNGTANRKKSDEDKMVCYLHRTCHTWLHNNPMTMTTFKKRAQKIWEATYGDRDQFIKRYGKSYL